MCLDAKGGIKAERQPFVVVGMWSCQYLLVVFRTRVNVIAPFCSCTCFMFRVWQQFLIHGHWNVRILTDS